jgi:dihydrodipicolinate synthase/N-acetylneuraminate lyase
MAATDTGAMRRHLLAGQVIPAHPLALTPSGDLDERHQRALTRYYVDAGAGGIAVGVHTTQFEIREHGLYRPVLELASETVDAQLKSSKRGVVSKVAGLVGSTAQATSEARIAVELGYHCGLLSLGAWRGASDDALIEHCREVAQVIPLFGFYLQPAVGGRVLSRSFWRRLAEIPEVVAVKIAPFNRYQTLDVVHGVAESGRDDIALYTGNDDSIVPDLLAPIPCSAGGVSADRRIVGGLLGQWAVWTHKAVLLLASIRAATADPDATDAQPGRINEALSQLLRTGAALTDANGALFDAGNAYAGCIPGIHEILLRQGLIRSTRTLGGETLSPGQREEINRVLRAYPWLADDEFVRERLDGWLR